MQLNNLNRNFIKDNVYIIYEWLMLYKKIFNNINYSGNVYYNYSRSYCIIQKD